MKNIIYTTVLTLISIISVSGQHFGASKACNLNAKDPLFVSAWKPSVDATFMYWKANGTKCTGTLINRNTDDAAVGFYFLTARHCLLHNFKNTIL